MMALLLKMGLYIDLVKSCPGGSPVISSNVFGGNYQWQVDDGTGYVNLSESTYYTSTKTSELQAHNLPTTLYGYKYRCLVDGKPSNSFKLIFETIWKGGANSSFEAVSNWSCSVMPDANTDVIIKNGNVVLSSNQSVRSMLISEGANFTVKPAFKLTITK